MKALTRQRIAINPFRTKHRLTRWAVTWRRKNGKRGRSLFGTRNLASLFADSLRPPPTKEAPEVKCRRNALLAMVGRA